MLNETMKGIAGKLTQVFGDSYEIHMGEEGQGLKKPCFLIAYLAGVQEQEIGDAYTLEQSFDIRYYPQDGAAAREMNDVADLLNLELEYIPVDGNLVRGTKMKHEVKDGVLHFLVNYNLRVRKVVESDPFMETLKTIEGVKKSGN